VKDAIALRFLVLFIGVMSCMYCLWDVIDDTIARKVNTSDAAVYAEMCGCCPSQVWGVIWLIQAFIFFVAGVLVGLVAFKQSQEQQEQASDHFLPLPWQKGDATSNFSSGNFLLYFSLLCCSALMNYI